MKRQLSTLVPFLFSLAVLTITIPSCKGGVKDDDIKIAADAALKTNPDLQGVTLSVKDGIISLGGEVKNDTDKSAAASALKDIKGVKSVENNITVAAPPAPAPVVTISADDSLSKSLVDAIKDHPGVKADVKDGIVTLTGEIKKTDLPKLMQKISALKPKKIDNKLTVK